MIVAANLVGDYIGEHPKYYSCPAYCEAKHEHIKSKIEVNNDEHKGIDSTILVQSRDGRSPYKGTEREHKYPDYWGEDRREDN